ncbi:MAG: LysR family transcriptional regulator [Stappiaceae bacterium]
MSFQLDRLANQLDWNLLLTFMVIVQERSITAAAQRLNVTQPSVSAALRRLEERLEVQLVERGSGRVFTITNAGEVVYREALEMYGGVVRLNELSRSSNQVLSGNIVIYRSSHLDISFLNALLAEFRKIHPGVTFSFVSTPCSDVVRALQQRVASLGFCTRRGTVPQLKSHQIDSQEFGFFCGPAHQLYQVEEPDPKTLALSDMVGFDGESLTGPLAAIVRFRSRNEIGDTQIATTSSIVDLIELIRHTTAIGSFAVNHAQKHASDLWQIPLNTANPLIDTYTVVDTDRHLTQAERALMTFLQERKVLA